MDIMLTDSGEKKGNAFHMTYITKALHRVNRRRIVHFTLAGGSCYGSKGHPGVDQEKHGCTHLRHRTF